MAFEDDAANSAGNGTPNDIGPLPTQAPAAPPIPVSPGAPTRPASPAPQAAPAALPTHENRPTHSFAESIRHALIGGTLGAMAKTVKVVAGPQPTQYTTDENGRVIPDPKQRPDNTVSRLERIAQSALIGLASGAAMPPQKSRMAALAGGIGAGANAARQQGEQQDLLKRKQSAEDYERGQKELTDKAVRAMHNASTYSLWQRAMDESNDHDPERKKNMDVVNALQEYNDRNPKNGMSVQIVTPEAAMALHEQDAHSVGKHTFLPLGMTQAKDANGQPVFEADGVTPKQTGQIAVISGDGKIPLPQSFVDDAKEYGKLAGISGADRLTSGLEIPLSNFLNIDKRLNDAKLKEQDGWKTAHDVILADGKTHAQMNTVTSKTRPYPEGTTPNVENKPAAQKVESDLKKEQTAEAAAKAAQFKKQTESEEALNPPASSGLTGDAYLQTLQPGTQNVLKAIAEGRETRSPRQLQDKNGNPTPLAEALHKAYPDFDDKKAAAYGAVVKDFTSGPTSRALTSYGTAINHARALYDNTGPNSYIPGTDEYKRYNQDITYVATEVAKALNPTGVATESAIKEQEDALRSITNRKAAIENAEHILSGKMSEVKQRWANAQVRPSYQPPMPSLSKEALDNAEYIRNQGSYQVTDPNGKAHKFPDQASADKFKKLAGIE